MGNCMVAIIFMNPCAINSWLDTGKSMLVGDCEDFAQDSIGEAYDYGN